MFFLHIGAGYMYVYIPILSLYNHICIYARIIYICIEMFSTTFSKVSLTVSPKPYMFNPKA